MSRAILFHLTAVWRINDSHSPADKRRRIGGVTDNLLPPISADITRYQARRMTALT